MRQPLVAGNWKMHGSFADNQALIAGIAAAAKVNAGAEVLVAPPFVYLERAQLALANTGIQLGSQNIAVEDKGAYTGEVAGHMLKEVGCRYVLVGHSERRSLYGETDIIVAQKFAAAQRHQLTPILCIGETLAERDANQTEQVIARQLNAVIDAVGIKAFEKSVIAYEPVWAIGTGKTASPEQAQTVHAFIRSILEKNDDRIRALVRVLYGGSVKAANAVDLFNMPDIDGALVGGAALDATEFSAIIAAAKS